jgi:hypothetical protein
MNLKEFDAKQFLLEKGEQVGLGIAVTLMVAMLVFSLFMPSQGFFSGSPAAKAKELADSTQKLDDQLRNRAIPDNELPDTDPTRRINLDTTRLMPSNYATVPWFVPGSKENPSRRPPRIYNIEEAVVKFALPQIDTYLFRDNFEKICVLLDENKNLPQGGGNGPNAFSAMRRGGMPTPPGGSMPNMRGGRGNPMMIPGAGGSSEESQYKPTFIPLEKWSEQLTTAHQLRPLRMAIVAGSFPYRQQLEEHKRQLRKANLAEVLEEADEDDKKENSFRFLGLKVERVEVDADGKEVGPWKKLDLLADYDLWLRATYFPLPDEDPKILPIRYDGLVMSLLREFHASKIMNKEVNPAMRGPGMFPGMRPNPAAQPEAPAPSDDDKSAYPDVVAELPKIQDTLAKLNKDDKKTIAAPKANTKDFKINPFRPNAPPVDNTQQNATLNTQQYKPEELEVPDYCLVRFCDVTLEVGKSYRYRVKIEMANPNYKREDVASTAYKKDEKLESKDWFTIEQTVRVPRELFYYVVDERQGVPLRDLKRPANANRPPDPTRPVPGSAASKLWAPNLSPSPEQVVFQFQRFVDQTPIGDKADSSMEIVGDWAIADRVLVGRGESVGRPVKIDIPIWRYAQNKFILPKDAKYPKGTKKSDMTTGALVDFNSERANSETVLVDFEGGKTSLNKTTDSSRLEVLMLDPDGKLIARNSVEDRNDEDRKSRREKVFKHIQEVREKEANQ